MTSDKSGAETSRLVRPTSIGVAGLTQLGGEDDDGKGIPYGFRSYKFRTSQSSASRTQHGGCYRGQEACKCNQVKDEVDGGRVCAEMDQPSSFLP